MTKKSLKAAVGADPVLAARDAGEHAAAAPAAPQVAIGRIVHYVLVAGGANKVFRGADGKHRPAIVVAVWPGGAEVVNLQVFVDGTFDWGGGGTLWATSVHYSEAGEPGTWHWPERVGTEAGAAG